MALLVQDEWKFAMAICGAQCVMIALTMWMPMWCVDNLDYHFHVRIISSALDKKCMDILSDISMPI